MSSNPRIDTRGQSVGVSDHPPETEARQAGWSVAILAYLIIALWVSCFRLGSTDVVTMEGIVADGARHMARTHEYAVPCLHGEIYSYKPPLTYWMALASFEIFGAETEWTLRLPFALSGLLMGLTVLLLTGRVLGPRTGLLCAIASLTGVLTLQKIHLAEFDMPLAAGVGVAVAAACGNFAAVRARGAGWLIAYLGLAAGFLAKGAPAVMFYGPGLLAAAVSTRRLKELLRPAHLAGVLLFALLAAGWMASAFAAEGWAAFEQPLAEAGDKGFTWTLAEVGSTLAKPVVAWAVFFPWTLLPLLALAARGSGDEPARRMKTAAGSFLAAGVLIFMLVPAAESRYLLPLTVPVGIYCGVAARDALALGRRRSVVAVGVLALFCWMTQVFVVTPHRASSRSLKSVAAAFDRHLPPGDTVWTGPVSKDFRQSSLFFYLRRPVKTLSADGGPAAGEHVILISEEHRDLIERLPESMTVVERIAHRDYELFLIRAETAGSAGALMPGSG